MSYEIMNRHPKPSVLLDVYPHNPKWVDVKHAASKGSRKPPVKKP